MRSAGRREEAYEAARTLYKCDKSPYACSAMFWTAVDMLRKLVNEGGTDEAKKIFLALERLLPHVPDREGWVSDAFQRCAKLVGYGDRLGVDTDGDPANISIGTWGEELASAYLRDNGYLIVERNWRSGHRDIDIVARKNTLLVFVEVKTRSTDDFGSPALAVNYKKQRNLVRAINHYLAFRHYTGTWRFDVISIVGDLSKDPQIEHIEDFQLVRF